MHPGIIVVGIVAVLALLLWSRKSAADTGGGGSSDGGSSGGGGSRTTPETGDGGGRSTTPGDGDQVLPIFVGQPITTPGSSPTNPVPWQDLTPAFKGWFAITSGATLTKVAGKLGCNWREIVAANRWAADQCPTSIKVSYYGGQDGLALHANYGKTPGVDCVAPGWQAKYYPNKMTGQFEVLYWPGR